MERKSCPLDEREWLLVITKSGVVAVISGHDVSILPASITVVFQARIGLIEARRVAGSLSAADYMSVNHRIKAGESGGLG